MSKEQMTIRLYPETRRQMDGWLEESNSKNRNEFVEKALRFYMGYLGTENITEFLSDALVATLRGIIADSTNRTNGILFKCAVEQGIMAHTIAAHFRDTLEDRRALRGYVVDEVKRTNGQIRFEDAQDIQRQLRMTHGEIDIYLSIHEGRQRCRSAGPSHPLLRHPRRCAAS